MKIVLGKRAEPLLAGIAPTRGLRILKMIRQKLLGEPQIKLAALRFIACACTNGENPGSCQPVDVGPSASVIIGAHKPQMLCESNHS